ncbi:hypothetical protein L5I01_20935 [Gordonia sp. HY442]|uniref:hypothetical protein n=1 Tax=Gordonia zhenghanii TaxID=2911516 RepID=UPI001F42E1BF|nr:hypothetical protein [Gordonia zhenghanii]MCF8605824.1 hypothetical protein [Gordonia zhenghanii]
MMKRLNGWERPSSANSPFNLKCRVDFNVDLSGTPDLVNSTSSEVDELWSSIREAWLFEDIDYGQWGLHILSPSDSAARSAAERAGRPEDFRDDDQVIGEFLGDSDLLVYSPSESGPKRISVALPLDEREEWYELGSFIYDVLKRMASVDGAKYWEMNPDA